MGITHEWNGTILTITSDSGSSSADLKGEKGDTGVRGPQGEKGSVGEFDSATLEEMLAENKNYAETAVSIAYEAETIAKGKASGYVFDTVVALDEWLANPNNTALLKQGDNLYIKALDVPDYWWDGTTKQELETQKVDLTNYVTQANFDNLQTELYELEQEVLTKTNDDYIIEQGVSDGWTYRKWNSGIAECWGVIEVTPVDDDTAGSLYYSESIYVDLPFTLASTTGVVTGSATNTCTIINSGIASALNRVYFRLLRGITMPTTAMPVQLEVKGTWK